jgi:hypothetical protein
MRGPATTANAVRLPMMSWAASNSSVPELPSTLNIMPDTKHPAEAAAIGSRKSQKIIVRPWGDAPAGALFV